MVNSRGNTEPFKLFALMNSSLPTILSLEASVPTILRFSVPKASSEMLISATLRSTVLSTVDEKLKVIF